VNLPYAERPDDEFLHPSGEWFLVLRAITHDNWLQWKHALPANPNSRLLLGAEEARWVEALAAQLHRIHEICPGYKSLKDSPFVVDRWFDPHDEGDLWSRGAVCRFWIKDLHSRVFLERSGRLRLPKQFKLSLDGTDRLVATLGGDTPPAIPPAQRSRGSGRK
jgi:hypothetical protein